MDGKGLSALVYMIKNRQILPLSERMKGLWGKILLAAKQSASISLTDLTCSPHTLNPSRTPPTSLPPSPAPTRPNSHENSSRVDVLWWVAGRGGEEPRGRRPTRPFSQPPMWRVWAGHRVAPLRENLTMLHFIDAAPDVQRWTPGSQSQITNSQPAALTHSLIQSQA